MLIPQNMKALMEYMIVALPFHADAATHEDLARKVNEKLGEGYDLLGTPFIGKEMMYQAMTRRGAQPTPIPAG